MRRGFDVARVARLASLGLTGEEQERFQGEFRAILDFMETVRGLPLEGVPPSVHSVPAQLRPEADEPRPGLEPEQALSSAPRRHGPFLQVPPILVTPPDEAGGGA